MPSSSPPWSKPYFTEDHFKGGRSLARGYGGQIIAAHPAKTLAVAITSDPAQPARSEGYFGDLMSLLEGPVMALG